ncbi:uncharacterized protein LOC117733890 [Cyclopterus lumpus]|uniref:uncharacterized protein LOC117733890 n=1 Tax=Cyclopterus lumpus TaxID=8103 RepID=UPI001486D012|nr:uncharacterized protein LOC117733890 [Cyclopterus lumpus]XP_034393711.1 uncharacterized protein LOC117733890 [Cyclopterus lumpus]
MEYTLLHTLVWLLPAFTFTTQELVKLSVSPGITAECGDRVILKCDVSSSRKGLSIKHMEWFQSRTSVCSVDGEGKIKNHTQSPSDFYCEYQHGQLSLVLTRVKPLERGNYTCKLQSNRGALHADTSVELQECCGAAESVWTKDRLTCTFKNVYPDGDVHWFHGSHKLASSGKQHTSKHMEKEGWLTIQSYLERKSPHVPYNCSLMSAASGRYIASPLVLNPESRASVGTQGHKDGNGVGSHGPAWTLLCISLLLAATLR